MSKTPMYCPKHYTSGSQLGECQIGILPCPDPLPINPVTTVTVRCGPCDKTLTIPISDIMRKKLDGLGSCVSDHCGAKVMLPPTPEPKEKVVTQTVTKEVPAKVPEGSVIVKEKDLKALQDRDDTLSKLEAAGVDNWEGYSVAFSGEDEEE